MGWNSIQQDDFSKNKNVFIYKIAESQKFRLLYLSIEFQIHEFIIQIS